LPVRFFSKSKKHDFLRIFELLHTFSRTLSEGRDEGVRIAKTLKADRNYSLQIKWTFIQFVGDAFSAMQPLC